MNISPIANVAVEAPIGATPRENFRLALQRIDDITNGASRREFSGMVGNAADAASYISLGLSDLHNTGVSDARIAPTLASIQGSLVMIGAQASTAPFLRLQDRVGKTPDQRLGAMANNIVKDSRESAESLQRLINMLP